MLRSLSLAALCVVALISPCLGDAFTDAAQQLPACGLTCIVQNLNTGSSDCGSTFNETCICSNSQDPNSAMQACIFANCTVLEQLKVASLSAQACSHPVRSRKSSLFIPLLVEIPAWVCVLLRLYSRWWTVRRFEVDDWIMMSVAVLYTIFLIMGQYAGAFAFGVDVWTLAPQTITQALKLFYVDESFYIAILGLTKISILFFYLRIFPNPKFRYTVYVIFAWVAVSTVIFIFLQIFQCVPVNYSWEGWTGEYGPHQCLNVNALSYTAAGFSIAQDTVLILVPLPLLLGLHASWRAKVGIILMFSLGVFVLITSCVRLRYLVVFARSKNPTWDYSDALIWSGAECAVSIIVTSLPAIRVLVNRLWPNLFGTLRSRTGTSGREVSKKLASSKLSSGPHFSASGLHSASSKGRSAQSRIFGIMTGPGGGSDEDIVMNESQLELGDRKNGTVQTEIGAGGRDDEGTFSEDGSVGSRSGPLPIRKDHIASQIRFPSDDARDRDSPQRGDSSTSSDESVSRSKSFPSVPGIHVQTTTAVTSARRDDDSNGPLSPHIGRAR